MIKGKFCCDCKYCIPTDKYFTYACVSKKGIVSHERPACDDFKQKPKSAPKSYEYNKAIKIQDLVDIINIKGYITKNDLFAFPNISLYVPEDTYRHQRNRARKYRKERNQYRSLYINGVQFIKQRLKEIERENKNE